MVAEGWERDCRGVESFEAFSPQTSTTHLPPQKRQTSLLRRLNQRHIASPPGSSKALVLLERLRAMPPGHKAVVFSQVGLGGRRALKLARGGPRRGVLTQGFLEVACTVWPAAAQQLAAPCKDRRSTPLPKNAAQDHTPSESRPPPPPTPVLKAPPVPQTAPRQFLGMLDIICAALDASAIPYVRLDGSCPAAQRAQMLADFAAPRGPRVFVASLKAGGVGM